MTRLALLLSLLSLSAFAADVSRVQGVTGGTPVGTTISGTVPLPTGAAADRTTAGSPFSVRISDGVSFLDPRSIRLLTSSDVVSISGTVPVSGSVNATLQTGANVIGSLSPNQSVNTAQINGVTPLMGNGATGTGSQHVTIASDNTAFPVNATLQTGGNVVGSVNQNGTWTVQPGNTQNTTPWLVANAQVSSANNSGTCTNVTASTTVLAAFASRKKATLIPKTTNTDRVHIKLGTTATTSFPPLEPGQPFELDGTYTGQVDAIAASGTQSVCVVEW